MSIRKPTDAVSRYFAAVTAALSGLDIFLSDRNSPFNNHDLVGRILLDYIDRLEATFRTFEYRVAFMDSFRISRAESGFPVFQNVLELENDRKGADKRLAAIPTADELREEMVDFILRQKTFPKELQTQLAERAYLEQIGKGDVFSPFILPQTVRVSVNPKTKRPYYVVHWGIFDGTQTLPMVYVAAIEDLTEALVKMLVGEDGKLNPDVDIPMPVDGLLNPDLAHRFDDFAEKNGAYSLTPATIALNMDKDFDELHPKQLRRFVLGPFYSAGITEHGDRVSEVLGKVTREENAWLLTWTLQEVFSTAERPARRGLWSSEPARQEFHIETDDLEAARQGVSAYEKHALVPHEAYQALYASGEADTIFGGYKVHVIAGNNVITEV